MDDRRGFWQTVSDWSKPLFVGAISAVATAAIVTGLTARDNRTSIFDLRTHSDRLEQRLESGFATCADRYAGVQAVVHALDSRVALNEAHVASHNSEARIWIDAIQENRRKIDELRNNPSKRPDPFTGSDGRKLDDRLSQAIRDLDKRLSILERYLDKDVIIMQGLMDDVKVLKSFHNGAQK